LLTSASAKRVKDDLFSVVLMVYLPREDSELLASVVQESAYGRVIDVGTGSGVLALAAAKSIRATEVLATDIDAEAVKTALSAGVKAFKADLFGDLEGFFDTIICNAPYLPDDARAPDIALDGGPKGFEWTLRFLAAVKERLSPHGQALLLISSLTKPRRVEKFLFDHALSFEVVASEKHSFEELFVYRIKHLFSSHPNAVFLARGRRSVVYRDGDSVLKTMAPERIAQEARMLAAAKRLGLGPGLSSVENFFVKMPYVNGVRIDEYLERSSRKDRLLLLAKVIRQLRLLDYAGVQKEELTNPYKHIIVSNSGPVLIDWERAKHALDPKNMRQFKEYLKRLQRKGIITKQDLKQLSTDSFSERVYQIVQRVPEGLVASYQAVANALGTRSARAVGQALAKNPYAPHVPCHRVVASNGRLTGFGGQRDREAISRKRRLLAAEGVLFSNDLVHPSCLLQVIPPK
jgi:methylated-DNA-[protein]-cysteine S-methyltransferase